MWIDVGRRDVHLVDGWDTLGPRRAEPAPAGPCSMPGCQRQGEHEGLCGRHWWEAHDRGERWDPHCQRPDVIADCIAQVVQPGETVTPRVVEDRLRAAWPWTWPATAALRRTVADTLELAAAAGACERGGRRGRPAYTITDPAAIRRCSP